MFVGIEKSFTTNNQSILELFQRGGSGFYIPLYQREYSWEVDNVDQLMTDIEQGVEVLCGDDTALRFLGSVILVTEKNAKVNVQPQDPKAIPPRIDSIIDGQQRISTIALLASVLYEEFRKLLEKVPSNSIDSNAELRTALETYASDLLEVFSLDLKRGSPKLKPIIIRGGTDKWTLNGPDTAYESNISKYLASIIRHYTVDKSHKIEAPIRLKRILKKMRDIISKRVLAAHKTSSDDGFTAAWEILEKIPQSYIWGYDSHPLKQIVDDFQNGINQSKDADRLCSSVQLMAFSYYLLKRCFFTTIIPESESWAFDMFQSLNATGTPLTAIETFKPIVVSQTNTDYGTYNNSVIEGYFSKVDALMSNIIASKKNSLTNQFITTFALTYSGKKLGTQFSIQKSWLDRTYNFECKNKTERTGFVQLFGDTSQYWKNVIQHDPKTTMNIPGFGILSESEKNVATTCLMFLELASHKISRSPLNRFYSILLKQVNQASHKKAATDFSDAAKAIAAFFTLWRSSSSTAGLDRVYRDLMKSLSHTATSTPDIVTLKSKLRSALLQQVSNETTWTSLAKTNLNYSNVKSVCKFVLFIIAHETISDPSNPGLMIEATKGTNLYLIPKKFISDDFKSIEHIAPRTPSQAWDANIYSKNLFETIGNLTLLPTDLNSSIGNKGWKHKFVYYQHLGETNPTKLTSLQSTASAHGVVLNSSTIKLLQKSNQTSYLEPVSAVGIAGSWDKAMIGNRTDRILSILWKRMMGWLK